nr:hypothetical protein [uncultured Fluviicola sp.]
MKKLILVAAVATFALASCKKDYTCTYTNSDGTKTTTTYTGLSKTAKTAAESTCSLSGGTFAKK